MISVYILRGTQNNGEGVFTATDEATARLTAKKINLDWLLICILLTKQAGAPPHTLLFLLKPQLHSHGEEKPINREQGLW